MEQNLENLANHIGGAVGNGITTGIDAFNTYQDIDNKNYLGALKDGSETVINGIDTFKDIESGEWIS